MAAISQHHRRYDFAGDLDKALNRVDPFRLFHGIALRYGFEHFCVLQVAAEMERPAIFPAKLVPHDLPGPASPRPTTSGTASANQTSTGACGVRSSRRSGAPWDQHIAGDDAEQQFIFLAQLGFDSRSSPLQANQKRRYAVVFRRRRRHRAPAACRALLRDELRVRLFPPRRPGRCGEAWDSPRETEILR